MDIPEGSRVVGLQTRGALSEGGDLSTGPRTRTPSGRAAQQASTSAHGVLDTAQVGGAHHFFGKLYFVPAPSSVYVEGSRRHTVCRTRGRMDVLWCAIYGSSLCAFALEQCAM